MIPFRRSGSRAGSPRAVLVSGGLDSAILLGDLVRSGHVVHPLYVRNGFAWEDAERDHLRGFLAAIATPALRPLTTLDVPVADLLPDHWGVSGLDVPDADSPDEAVYLPGRNVLLLSKSMLWCHLNGVASVALATLRANPFPDATPRFFADYARAVNRAIGGRVGVDRPFARRRKVDVMRLGAGLPLELTFSCIRPVEGGHCGACNKCAERRRAFDGAGLPDPTRYATSAPAHAA
jgi:7-cyano-7-deazaguanine synthase